MHESVRPITSTLRIALIEQAIVSFQIKALLSVFMTYSVWLSIIIYAGLESQGHPNLAVRRIVVVGVAVVVDIAEVRGIARISRSLPPVAPATTMDGMQTMTKKSQ